MTTGYFRLDYPEADTAAELQNSSSLADLVYPLKSRLRAGDYVLAARFQHATNVGLVRVVGKVMQAGAAPQIEWRAASMDLHPSPQGATQWRKPHFKFADSVAQRYNLAGFCQGVFRAMG